LVECRQLGWSRLSVIVGLLELGRGYVPQGGEQAAAVVPRHPLERRELDVLEPLPRTAPTNLLRLEQPNHGLGQGVVVRIPGASHGGLDAGFGQPLGVPNRQVLPPAIAVMHQPLRRLDRARVERVLQRIEGQVTPERAGRAPAYDPAREHIDHERHVDKPAPGCHVGEVRHPQLIGACRRELARDQIRPGGRRVRNRRYLELPAPHRAPEPVLAHQPRPGAAGDRLSFAPQLLPDLAHAVDRAVPAPHPLHVLAQGRVPPGPCRLAGGLPRPGLQFVVQRRGDRQHGAHRSASRSACRTQLRNVSGVQPIFSAIEVIAHWELYLSCCSSTIRTARSRTSGEYLLGLAMTPPSQGLESPGNPGRFTVTETAAPARDRNGYCPRPDRCRS
jgi:hypothetical protein